MMTEIGVFNKATNMYLVRGHTKKLCNCLFMLLNHNFHYKNIYTKQQLNDNLNQNNGVEAKEILAYFFNLDELLDFFKRDQKQDL